MTDLVSTSRRDKSARGDSSILFNSFMDVDGKQTGKKP